MNICRQLIGSPAYLRSIGEEIQVDVLNRPAEADDFSLDDIVYFDVSESTTIPLTDVDTSKDSNYVFALSIEDQGIYEMEMVFRSELEAMAQIPVTVFTQSVPAGVITFNGTGGQWSQITKKVCMATRYVAVRLYFAQSGVQLKEMKLRLIEKVKDEGAPFDVEGEYDMAFR